MNKGGVLVYQCRRCGKLDKSRHSPYPERSMSEILHLGKTQDKNTFTWSQVESHLCEDGASGVVEIIGVEEDK